MPTHFLLSGEVKHPAELEHADFLLTDHPKSGESLDLLLGTQGWRRFAEQEGMPADPSDKADVDKMLVAHGRGTTAPLELYKLEQQRVDAEFRPRAEKAAMSLAAAETKQKESAKQNVGIGGEIAKAETAVNDAEKQTTDAQAELYKYQTR